MEDCRSLLKSTLVVIVLVAMFQSGSAEKLASCCKKASIQEITEPIIGYQIQPADPPCVLAVLFQTKSGYFCSYPRAPWVRPKIAAFKKAQAAASSVAPSTPVSLLSIITSTASPSTSSTPPSSSSTASPSTSSTPPSSSSTASPSTSSTPPSSSSLPLSSSPVPASSSFHLLSSSSLPASSSSSLPASSSSLPSSPTTSEMPAGETFSTAGSSVSASSLDD